MQVTDRAKSILRNLEDKALKKQLKDELQINMFEVESPTQDETAFAELIAKIEEIDINNITPVQALEVLNSLVEMNKKV